MRDTRPRVLFLGTTYAGWKTRQINLERHTRADPRIQPVYRRVTGWREGGLVERVPFLPAGVKGRIRALAEARDFARLPRPDITWTSCLELALPFLWAQTGPLRRPLVMETDWVFAQQEALAETYFGRAPRAGLAATLGRNHERMLFSRVTLFLPISNWAAAGLRGLGIAEERIRVLHPGLDMEAWSAPERRAPLDRPLRLLFVGGDFVRKGGPMLVGAVRTRFAGRCELDIVTRDSVAVGPGVRVHHAEPNSPLLRQLYRDADLFVLPTQAECFGFATTEAAASGLPAIASDVGGVRDIVEDGVTGWLIEPRADSLAAALERALAEASALPAMGRRARQRAESRFDGAKNDRLLVDLLLEQLGRWRSTHHQGGVAA